MLVSLICALTAALLAFAVSAEEENIPVLGVGEAFVAQQGMQPRQLEHAGESLRTAVLPGSTVYLSIANARRAEDLNGYRPVVQWSKGEEDVSYIRIEYREMFDSEGVESLGYRYVVAIGVEGTGDEAMRTLRGSIKLARRTGQNMPELSFTISVGDGAGERAQTISCSRPDTVLDFRLLGETVAIDFDGFCLFEVAGGGQGEINGGCSRTPITDIAERHRGAQLSFIRWTKCPIFDHVGRLTVFPQEGKPYLYEVIGGRIWDVSGSYSAGEDAYILSARRLEGFVFSDRELDPDAPQVPEANPPTGAQM